VSNTMTTPNRKGVYAS